MSSNIRKWIGLRAFAAGIALVFSFENARRALNGETLENPVQVLD